MRNLLIFSLIPLTLACSGDASDSGADSSGVPDFAPTEGGWTISNSAYTTDGCNFTEIFPIATQEVVVYTLTHTDIGFDLQSPTGDPVNCTLTMMDFECPASLVSEPTEWPEGSGIEGDPDAILTVTSDMTGSFADAQSASFSIDLGGVCEGADCDAYLEAMGSTNNCSTVYEGDISTDDM